MAGRGLVERDAVRSVEYVDASRRKPDLKDAVVRREVCLRDCERGERSSERRQGPIDERGVGRACPDQHVEERSVAPSSPYEIGPDVYLQTCSAEDLVVHKVFAGRDKDWLDVESIVLRQADRLDRALILREVQPLLALEGEPAAEARLRALFAAER